MKQLQGLPELVVTLAGRRLTSAEVAAIDVVRVHTELARPAQCEVTWDVSGGTLRIDAGPGDAMSVEVAGAREPLFRGEVTVLEVAHGADASARLRLRGYDALHRLRKRQATRVHEDADLAGLAGTLVAGTGLGVDGPAIPLGRVYQVARSDLDLLVTTCARLGRYPVVDGAVLRLLDLAGHGSPIDLELGASLHSASLEVSQEPAYRSAESTGWEPGPARAARAEAAGSSPARASAPADPAPASTGGGGAVRRADEVVGEPLLKALARAELDVRAAGEVTATLVAEGDPQLRAGRRVRVRGVTPRFEGEYLIAGAVHVIDGSGYETTITTRPPAGPPTRPRDVVTLGSVDRVDDPEGRGRALVRLLAHPDLVTDWAPVVLPAAGPGKGLVFLPAPGDAVLVLLPGGDPGAAIVLGGLYGLSRTPDAGDDGPRQERFTAATSDGQRITLDGHGRRISLDDGHGSRVELGPDLVRLTAATDLVIEAPGRALTVRARTVDFEEAP